MKYEASLEVQNAGNADFSGIERIDYQINDIESGLVSIVTELAQGESQNFSFSFDLAPGDYQVNIMLGESEMSEAIYVAGADVTVEIIDHRFKRGNEVEFDIEISNDGELVANGLVLNARWSDEPDDSIQEAIEFRNNANGLNPNTRTNLSIPIKIPAGSYQFKFDVSTTTIESRADNNSTSIELDVEFVDLRVNVISAESLGWDSNGNALIEFEFDVENNGVDDSPPFDLSLECVDNTIAACASSTPFQAVPARDSRVGEMTVWMPVGETATRIYAVEDEDSFRWGNLNAITHTQSVTEAPDLVWNLSRISEPQVISYWSDGSANVDLDLTFVNNGIDETRTVSIECMRSNVIVDDCGGEIEVQKVPHSYPTIVGHTLRLPSGNTRLIFHYGDDEPQATSATVPERIVGVERDVWECFSDTSFVYLLDSDGHDQGIGCGGWDEDYVIKWPVGDTTNVWVTGDPLYVSVFEDVLEDLAPLLNIDFQYVENRFDAQLVVYTGWPEERAKATGLDCVDFGGCAETWDDPNGRITESTIAIWSQKINDGTRLRHAIEAITLHELLHAFTNIGHRHHDHTSVMSYDAINFTTIDGIDLGLFQLLTHPLVEPGMSFEQVRELIVFSDELNDPPEPQPLSAEQMTRRAAAAMFDAGSVRFEMQGNWPGATCNHRFGPATYDIGNLRLGRNHWTHFDHGSEHYYIIRKPDEPYDHHDGELVEFWLNRGRTWEQVNSDRIYDNSNFRGFWSNPLNMLSHINVYANPSDYEIVLHSTSVVMIEVELDGPNPEWSRSVNVDIRIEMHPETFEISKYELTWNFDPKHRDSCEIYTVKARNGEYGFEFKFPNTIRQGSKIID